MRRARKVPEHEGACLREGLTGPAEGGVIQENPGDEPRPALAPELEKLAFILGHDDLRRVDLLGVLVDQPRALGIVVDKAP